MLRLQRRYLAAISLVLALVCTNPYSQPTKQAGDCSPTLSNVRIDGDIIFNCDQGRRELQRFARELTKVKDTLRLSAEQTTVVIETLNSVLPYILAQLNKIDVFDSKQDKALDALTELLRRTPPADFEKVLLVATKQKFLPGYQVSDCGCWGKPFFSDDKYGSIRKNSQCLNEQEETVACVMNTGSNVCGGGGFLERIFGADGHGYAPWARVCK